MQRTCSSLKCGENVVFKTYSDIYKKKIPMDGTVIDIYPKRQMVVICWLEGYKSRTEHVDYSDMIAVHNPDGEMMKFNSISGKSDLLLPE